MRRISAGESKDISTERAIVHRAFMTTTSRGGVAPFCGRPDGKHPCGVLCDTLTDAAYELRAPAAARLDALEAEREEARRLLVECRSALRLCTAGHTRTEIADELLRPPNGSPFSAGVHAQEAVRAFLATPSPFTEGSP